MLHVHHTVFTVGIDRRLKVVLTFYSKEDSGVLVRTCAPMDYGPSRRAKDKVDRYHCWDYDSDQRMHVLSLRPEQILSIEATTVNFDPAEFVTWQPIAWFYPRHWGAFSGTAGRRLTRSRRAFMHRSRVEG